MRRSLALAMAALAAVALSAAAFAAAEVGQVGKVRVVVSGDLSPTKLPRAGAAPISVAVGGKISTTDGSEPPTLKTMTIELNRAGRIETDGLPVCDYDLIQPASTSRALQACKSSLVGKGSFNAEITLTGQEPYPTRGTLLAFNGMQNGKHVLFGQIYAPRPFATSFVIVFAIKQVNKGPFGTALVASLPDSLRTWGDLTGIELRLSRRYSSGGERRSYISAGCAAPKAIKVVSFPLARASFGFEGGPTVSSTLTRICRAKG